MTAQPINHENTLRWLNGIKRDYWWQSQMPVSTTALDAVCGIGEVRHALDPNRPEKTDETLNRIGRLIPDIERRKLVFPEVKTGKPKAGEHKPPSFSWLDLPEHMPAILRLSTEAAWSLHAVCRNCGGNKFLPVEIDGKGHAACYHCLPPSQHRAIGAKPVKKSLIHEALKKHF